MVLVLEYSFAIAACGRHRIACYDNKCSNYCPSIDSGRKPMEICHSEDHPHNLKSALGEVDWAIKSFAGKGADDVIHVSVAPWKGVAA